MSAEDFKRGINTGLVWLEVSNSVESSLLSSSSSFSILHACPRLAPLPSSAPSCFPPSLLYYRLSLRFTSPPHKHDHLKLKAQISMLRWRSFDRRLNTRFVIALRTLTLSSVSPEVARALVESRCTLTSLVRRDSVAWSCSSWSSRLAFKAASCTSWRRAARDER
ncbi:hypothetical protein SCHPADRAFT_740795 [Schizopora paradoxa]|uniref:Uncharacterized protein n=1 Tax=Schizopora paradoxa TaxID=27342 RepID=A0A0H2QZX8_9AGAM|nr:hypothetical protein SCHPADRAFT_740795 [Schizopora paradoxa]